MNYYLVSIFTFFGYILYKCYIYPLYLSPLRKIPGPPGNNFIFGHLISLFKDKQGEAFILLAKQYGGIIRFHTLLNKPYISITDPKLVQQVLINRPYEFPKFFISKSMVKDLVGKDDYFDFLNFKEMLPTFIQAGHKLKDAWLKQIGNKKEERITITALIPKITLDVIGLVGFNYEFNSITSDSELAQAYHSITNKTPSFLYMELSNIFPFIKKIPTSYNNQYWDSIKTINNVSEKLIAEQKNATVRGKDLLSLLIKINENLSVNEQLTHNELRSLVMTLLLAGHETTSSVLSWALYYLAKNPDIQDHLRKEVLDKFPDRNHFPTFEEIDHLKYLECVFKESLRISPPDEIMNGYGTQFIIPIYAIHHDPSIWGDDAEFFNPSRWLDPEIKSKISNNNFLPFGAGARNCLGMKMAQLEFKCVIPIIIRNFEFRLVEGFTFKKSTNGFCKPIPGIDLFVSKEQSATKNIPGTVYNKEILMENGVMCSILSMTLPFIFANLSANV
ncbi:3942_t:CDS:2 [Cetraspora pellucida]|uniref:3942_t:CDS:1 n=1 Tax=Cetraspora pellucida TaxID=1433469 RepID=A0A9N9C3M8_9GLOM|nr:3942_t:CDS:2 [Cetraspora pellucida]